MSAEDFDAVQTLLLPPLAEEGDWAELILLSPGDWSTGVYGEEEGRARLGLCMGCDRNHLGVVAVALPGTAAVMLCVELGMGSGVSRLSMLMMLATSVGRGAELVRSA